MKFCVKMYLGNFYKPIEYQGHRSKIKATWVFCVLFSVHGSRGQHFASSEDFTCYYFVLVIIIIIFLPLVLRSQGSLKLTKQYKGGYERRYQSYCKKNLAQFFLAHPVSSFTLSSILRLFSLVSFPIDTAV